MFENKKAVSPVISTILLVMIVIILAIIILLWARGFVDEAVEKEIAGNSKRVNEFCLDVKLKGIVNVDEFGFENVGNVPVFAFNLKLTDGGGSRIVRFDNENGGSVNPGFSFIAEGYSYNDYEEVKIIPILLGQSSNGQKEFECDDRDGFVI
ncbi:hypothetical protein CMI42_02520 [Candidatus Pacearchaeota archaeon]|nr:hypothetical protein [Candidatus Pacearchaeota archaeon]|tara:strand:+ start:2506 stop:2961 length:456 start_codon:yes stop_codon:yes gene_type:complete